MSTDILQSLLMYGFFYTDPVLFNGVKVSPQMGIGLSEAPLGYIVLHRGTR
jgi:hypothetical protein